MDPNTRRVVRDRRVAQPPRTLWRVQHSGNQDCVFTARAAPAFHDDDDFCELRKLHLDWDSDEPTPFLSTFASKRHAFNWAAHRGLVVFGAGGDEFLVLDEIPIENVGNYICSGCLRKGVR